MTVDACKAGKDVYVEKPLTHNLPKGPRSIDAQNRNKRIVQVGTQQRSMPHIQKAYELIESRPDRQGIQGPPDLEPQHRPRPASFRWASIRRRSTGRRSCGTAEAQPFDEYRFRNWRWFWDFGGGILTDLMVHWIDVAHWFLDLDHPTRPRRSATHSTSKGVWETPDTVQTPADLSRTTCRSTSRGRSATPATGRMIEFMGTEATLYIDRGRYEI